MGLEWFLYDEKLLVVNDDRSLILKQFSALVRPLVYKQTRSWNVFQRIGPQVVAHLELFYLH